MDLDTNNNQQNNNGQGDTFTPAPSIGQELGITAEGQQGSNIAPTSLDISGTPVSQQNPPLTPQAFPATQSENQSPPATAEAYSAHSQSTITPQPLETTNGGNLVSPPIQASVQPPISQAMSATPVKKSYKMIIVIAVIAIIAVILISVLFFVINGASNRSSSSANSKGSKTSSSEQSSDSSSVVSAKDTISLSSNYVPRGDKIEWKSTVSPSKWKPDSLIQQGTMRYSTEDKGQIYITYKKDSAKSTTADKVATKITMDSLTALGAPVGPSGVVDFKKMSDGKYVQFKVQDFTSKEYGKSRLAIRSFDGHLLYVVYLAKDKANFSESTWSELIRDTSLDDLAN